MGSATYITQTEFTWLPLHCPCPQSLIFWNAFLREEKVDNDLCGIQVLCARSGSL